MDFLFGADTLWVRFIFAFVIVLALIGLTAFLVRRFGAGGIGASSSRGRQPRLAVIDAAAVDGRRRLILIRRDNVEHLLMIGGPSDVVVEANIVRAAQGARDAAGGRQPEALPPRTAPMNEGNMWPLQPEPVPAPPPPRPQRQQPATMEEPPPWHNEPEAPPPMPRRPEPRPEPRVDMRAEPRAEGRPEPRDMRPEPRDVRPEPRDVRPEPRPVDPLAGLAAELSRVQPEAPVPKPRPPREREAARARAPQPERIRPVPPSPAPMDEPTAANTDQNLAEMAQRLEAALRRPKAGEPRAPEAGPKPVPMTAPVSEPVIPMADPVPPPAPVVTAAQEDIPPPARLAAAAKPQKSVYDSLEQEMASLLGRPNSKA